MSLTSVTDVAFDGTTIEIRFGTHVFPMLSLGYGDNLDKGEITPMGSQEVVAITPGTYKVEATKGKMVSAELVRMVSLFPKNGLGNFKFPIYVIKSHPDLGSTTNTLLDNYIMKLAEALDNSSKAIETEFEIKTRQILWNGRSINRRGGIPNGGTLQI